MALIEQPTGAKDIQALDLGTRIVLGLGGIGAIALLFWRLVDLFTVPLTLGREILDLAAFAFVGVATLWVVRWDEERRANEAESPSEASTLATAISSGGLVGIAASTLNTLSSIEPRPGEVALFKAIYVAGIATCLFGIVFGVRAATRAARAWHSGAPSGKGAIWSFVVIILYGIQRVLDPKRNDPQFWWEIYFAPTVLILTYYLAVRARLSIQDRLE